jgi:hypothetical protein
MASWEDVRRFALELAETEERLSRGNRQWRVAEKLFVWERPLRAKEMQELGERAPDGPVLGARVESLAVKEALIEDDPHVFFTTSHFDGYAAILARLDLIATDDLRDLIAEAWRARAPKRLLRGDNA